MAMAHLLAAPVLAHRADQLLPAAVGAHLGQAVVPPVPPQRADVHFVKVEALRSMRM